MVAKGRMETLKTMGKRDNRWAVGQEDVRSRDGGKVETKNGIYEVWG
jgi:hypothetical protein